MSAAAVIQLTQEQRESIIAALNLFESHIVSRGAALMRERAVRSLRRVEDGLGLEARVQGGKLYTTTLFFDGPEAVTDCTCPYQHDCKHAAAVILELRKHAGHAKSVASPAGTLSGRPEKPTAFEVPSLPPDSFAGQIEAKVGKKLNKTALKFLATVEPWWLNKTSLVDQMEIHQACGRSNYWGYRQLSLWPDELPPTTLWEFIAYLAMAMKKSSLEMPPPLPEVVDPMLQKELLKKWQRLQEIEEWKKNLGSWQEPEEEAGAPAPELRLVLHSSAALIQVRHPGDAEFGKVTQKLLKELSQNASHGPSYGPSYGPQVPQLSAGSSIVLQSAQGMYREVIGSEIGAMSESLNRSLARLISSQDMFFLHVASASGEPVQISEEALKWELLPALDATGNYKLRLLTAEGIAPPPPVAILPGSPMHYVTSEVVYPLSYWPFKNERQTWPVTIPAQALETREGVSALAKLGLEPPARLAGKIKLVKADITIRSGIHRYSHSPSEYFRLDAKASFGGVEAPRVWNGSQWITHYRHQASQKNSAQLIQLDKSALSPTGAWLRQMSLRPTSDGEAKVEQRIVGKDWPDQFLAWLDRRPPGINVELDAELATLRDGKVAGTMRLDIEESKSGVDWFDLSLALDVSDHTLTQEEIDLLLKAKGRWVKLGSKGWRKLEFDLSTQQQQDLADLGLSTHQLTGEKQRLHALQLGSVARGDSHLLPAERAQQVRRRLEEIETRVTPDQPAAISATLRQYQTEGFHFLAYLSTNRFGGVLADDMGLGKTLQALTWMAWLRAEQKVKEPLLVVCPKSVQDNWRAEAARFCPDLKVEVWNRSNAGKTGLDGQADLLVIHYPHLRIHEETLREVSWGAVILDEAQAIKNPTSQSAKAACALDARHRLALTGTPIENRLLDLWSIFAFAMPGILGSRASFNRIFDASEDPLARRRLAARTKPFLLRRTKQEVATDLPDRVEEDLIVEMEGTQATLYQAEIKRARAQLLKVETSRQLDKFRFNILTSLLRLRQICCDPRLIGLEKAAVPEEAQPGKRKKKAAASKVESAKLAALIEQMEPIMEEGQKVLVFSQFVEMLEIIQAETSQQGWTTFILTGATEDRGALVSAFQEHDGPAIFLISLKAGGFGLNLTAASYVILYDPWWNPAVEAQAIDRTHRIGQKQTVFAYRLLIKDSIEEKIRMLQKQKGALAQDILGEESFAQGLTLSDFSFLLG
ncbi:DEAD/DEAH box helicase [Prosthecobacter sp. SYSU 5D2]|uniref:DEAD/DEAH box helicase n=1 Tax=Prosthecobacter sp. SYSU 5D2 TaxID=3134134 RepID=UPI0031FEEAD4